MSSDIGEVCNKIVMHISENCDEKARSYCRDCIDSDIEPNTDEYQRIKSEAIDETEVWGDESRKWLKLVPAAADEDETESEWRFVVGNLLISSVMECETTGSLIDDALIAKAANKMFSELHKSDRHEMLSLAVYHHKMGHVFFKQKEEYEPSVEHFEKSLDIIREHDMLGGWHHHALALRDATKVKAEYHEEQDEVLKAVQTTETNAEKIEQMGAPTSEKFYKHIKAEEHRLRARMADKLDKTSRQRKHLRKCSRLYSEAGKEDLADKYGRKEMQVSDN